MFRIVMSSIMRRRRGLNSAIGGSCLRDRLQHPHPLRQEPLNKPRRSRRAGGFVQSPESIRSRLIVITLVWVGIALPFAAAVALRTVAIDPALRTGVLLSLLAHQSGAPLRSRP